MENALANHRSDPMRLRLGWLRRRGRLARTLLRVALLTPLADAGLVLAKAVEVGDGLLLPAGCANFGFHDFVLLNVDTTKVVACTQEFMPPNAIRRSTLKCLKGNLAKGARVRMFSVLRGSN
jgi:hypothetical protein